MSRILVSTAVATVLAAGAFLAGGANAMTLTAPAGVRAAIGETTAVEKTRYVCYRVKRHGRWRQVCSWRPNYYAPRAYYYSEPYYRPYGYGYYPYHRRPGVSLRFGF